MLNEEEIINRLKERIKIDRSMRLNVESDFDRFCEEECQAIEGLIDLYNKEKEKNMVTIPTSSYTLQNKIHKLEEELKREKEKNSKYLEYQKDKIRELKNFYIKDCENKDITIVPLENLVKNINILLEE